MQKIKEIMSTNVQVIGPDATITDAAQKMQKGNFGMLPVEENDRMIGSISDRDIAVRAVAAGKPLTTKVREVMTEGIIWAFEDDSIADAAEKMSEHQIRRLPIVNSSKRLVGIVALGDFAVDTADIKVAGEVLSEISQPA
ncbi:MAG: CBS domain-containing protein [Betaproteobacteria bacterium]